MLQDDFYTILSIHSTGRQIEASISLNPVHPIYEGHFPGNPVMPGVCMLQIIKEILQAVVEKEIQLTHAIDIKFLSMVMPDRATVLKLSLKYEQSIAGLISLNALVMKEDAICFKCRATYKII